jgi:predicted small secreted protein
MQKRKNIPLLIAIILILSLVLAACQQAAPEPTRRTR